MDAETGRKLFYIGITSYVFGVIVLFLASILAIRLWATDEEVRCISFHTDGFTPSQCSNIYTISHVISNVLAGNPF